MSLVHDINRSAEVLKIPKDINSLVDFVNSAQIVMLGESTHGTHEFYSWRAEISKQLIEKYGFTAIALEADWPNCSLISRFVNDFGNNPPSGYAAVQQFDRWPSWLWSNIETAGFIDWIRSRNRKQKTVNKISIFGMDIYSLWESLGTVSAFMEKFGSEAAQNARRAYKCFDGFDQDPQLYAQAALVPAGCEEEVIALLNDLQANAREYKADGYERYFNALQNARIIKNAESYYRSLMLGGTHSWNIRESHMAQTLADLLSADHKIIVWAHNTHIGDARATEMAQYQMHSLGQLVRQQIGSENCALVGFGTYQGTTLAAPGWEMEGEVMPFPPSFSGTWESYFHQAGNSDKYLLFTPENCSRFSKVLPSRAIGIVYDPLAESGNYVETRLSARYDAFVYLDHTRALTALPAPILHNYFRA
jgi:erythromycin esterase